MDSLKVGDKVIYPNQGLGIVEAIRDQAVDGLRSKIYHLRLLSNNTLVMIPLAGASELGIRRPVSEDRIDSIFHLMRKGGVEITKNWKGRYKEHVNLMRSGSLLDMISVLKGLYHLSLTKPLSFREKKMMEKAHELIVSELSLACSRSTEEIEKRIQKSLTVCFKGVKAELGF
ncbi:MAG TPA: CarD family transcriptional regulator [Acidobacteriota bacterium]|jgi:CarD family transcriptional regulator